MRFWMPLLGVCLAAVAAPAQPKPAAGGGDRGLYVPVPHPLTSDAVTRIKNSVNAERAKGADRPDWVVFDFTPNGKEARNPDAALAIELASYIAGETRDGLSDVKTVGFATRKVSGHTVLPFLACRDLVMGKDASVGEVVAPGDPPLVERTAKDYESILKLVRPTQMAAVRKMFDPRVKVGAGKKGGGEWLVNLADPADKASVENPKPVDGVSAEGVGLYKPDVAVRLGLARGIRDTRTELADLLGIAPSSLRDDPLNGRPPEAFRYTLSGAIDQGVKESVARTIEGIVSRKGNLLFLRLECAGGDLDAARELAELLTKFQKPASGEGIKIVAFVPNDAPDTGAIVALGCSEIVLSRRTDAKAGDDPARQAIIGDFSTLLASNPQAADTLAVSLRQLAEEQGYPPLLAEGMVRKDMAIVFARSKVDQRKTKLLTQEEYDAAGGAWVTPEVVKPRGSLLKLTADQAARFGLAKTTDTRDLDELATKYGVEPGRVKDATPAWLDRFAAFLRNPTVTVLLVVIGFVGLILELKVPGATIPGVIAALAFICVFWAHTQFSGQLAVLAGMLFLLGLILILLEVFVIPGIGAALIFGILLMVGSLALVTVQSIPDTGGEWVKLGGKMATYLFALMAGFVVALLIARYLPSLPFANKMFLPPVDDTADLGGQLPGAAKAAALLGASGVTTTVLRPAGTVLFGDEFVDVVTEGGYVEAGAKVQVIEVEGTRIVVKAV